MLYTYPRIVMAALKGGSGKTILSLGLISAWQKKGLKVSPFKKGPDFIDAGWLSLAANRSCYNLDPFLMSNKELLNSFIMHSDNADISLLEGNRGLYDGLDIDGKYSTAQVAKLIKSPVLIILDVTMATRTMAALIKGCQVFDRDLNIAGVILNRVSGARQETLIRKSIEKYCNTLVLGSVPKLKRDLFPERHMGLVPSQETASVQKALAWARTTVEQNLQVDEILKIARITEAIDQTPETPSVNDPVLIVGNSPVIGFIKDKSFWFYYPENLDLLKRLGADLVEIDAINHRHLPSIDALYIGGGFPETQAGALADNKTFRTDLKKKIAAGLPVYAECGGFIYLGENLTIGEKTYPMVGALPVKFDFKKRPQGHGYTSLEVTRPNPYFPVGAVVKGHEFHYSNPVITEKNIPFVFKMKRGQGINGKVDGIFMKNVLASYSHIHAGGNRRWATTLVKVAATYKLKKPA